MSDPYATHLPVLRAVLKTYEPKRVLELGIGMHSTPLFLNAGVSLTSLETNGSWFCRAENLADFDIRLVDDIPASLPSLTDYDLVFVDDSDNATDRERTIRAVLSQPHPLTVIHDAEVPEYRAAMKELSDPLFICAMTPHTALCWPEGADRKYTDLLAALNGELATA
jgi:hypothetical protein